MSESTRVPRPLAPHVSLRGNLGGMDLIDTESQPDMRRLRAYRLGRAREKLREADLAGIVLFDPANVRYASGTRNMPVWTLHNAPWSSSLLARKRCHGA